ncbi:hypothetical protein [Paenibacillus woosongensis]|uniref:Uncharacterized protein n=1 Tax=Paenibacillus woosongensis TaxID=307580 RepID=A0ABQ4MRC8_9BACL|nr:hypothetical protein [Paenibacillus woosongensis]GIP58547.1 hypothetical protein J15TS10_23610 [Paenibacillus woosongensis]
MESLGQGPVLNQQELEHLSQLLSRGSWDNDPPAETSPDLDLRSEPGDELESGLELDAELKLGLDPEPKLELDPEPNPELELETELELELESDLSSVLEPDPNPESNSDIESASDLGQKHGYLTEGNYYELDQPEELLSEDEPDYEESTDQFGAILRAFAEAGAAEEVEEDEDSKEEDEYMSFFEKVHADFELGSGTELSSHTEEAAAVIFNEHDKTIQIDVMALNDQKQSLKLTLDSFSYLVSWLKEKGIPVDSQQ